MRLFRLTYVSTAVEIFTPESLKELVQRAAAKNATLDVTGALLFSGGAFMQALEGPEGAVADLYARIELDPRHTFIECVQRDHVENRLFPEWSMTLQNFDEHAAIDPKHLLVIRSFLEQCSDVDPDQATEGLVGFFRQAAARVAA